MAFLYSAYIVIYAICSPLLGRYIDGVYNRSGGSDDGGTIFAALVNTAGVQFTILCVVVFTSTFVPRGAFSFNPVMLNDEVLDHDLDKAHVEEKGLEGARRASVMEDRRQSVTRISADINDTFQPDLKNINEVSRENTEKY